MDFQEYPKCLYRDGTPESEYVVVFSAEEEEASEFLPLGASVQSDPPKDFEEAPKRKPGRPKKV